MSSWPHESKACMATKALKEAAVDSDVRTSEKQGNSHRQLAETAANMRNDDENENGFVIIHVGSVELLRRLFLALFGFAFRRLWRHACTMANCVHQLCFRTAKSVYRGGEKGKKVAQIFSAPLRLKHSTTAFR